MLSINQEEFRQLTGYIKNNYGIDLKEEKRTLVMGRLHQLLQSKGFASYSDFFRYVLADKSGAAAGVLMDKLTTNHTYFMREVEHFRFFRNSVLPYLRHSVLDRDLRIWCAACSTGEESVTLAILLDEFFGREKAEWDTKILATDISGKVLEAAAKGIYANERLAELPPSWRMNYFSGIDKHRSAVVERIQNDIIYRRFNLMETRFPFKRKFHAIFCRNVMIYFDHPTKTELIHRLYNQLEYGGYLFIGHSESIQRDSSPLKYVMPAVYRKE